VTKGQSPHPPWVYFFHAELDIMACESGKHGLSVPSLLDFTDHFNILKAFGFF
jgi:hypothetical protein